MHKRSLLVWSILILLLAGCGKGSENYTVVTGSFQSYVRFRMDNAPIALNTMITASAPYNSVDSAMYISGSWNAGDFRLNISGSNQALVTGTYSFSPTRWHSAYIWTYTPAVRYVAGMDLLVNTYYGSGFVTITEISAQYVKGTFEFTTGTDPGTNTFKTVTAGEFHVKRN